MSKDVAIIGGSAAGLFTAHLLAGQGLQVSVFEANERIDPVPRTLIVTHRLSTLIGSSCRDAAVNTIRRFELFADGKFATIELRTPDLVIERSTLIQRLATKAEHSGAKIETGHRFVDVNPNGKNLTLTLSPNGNGEFVKASANILVGADGAFSTVAQKGFCRNLSTVPLLQAVVELPKDLPSDVARVWFLPEDTPYFYWLIPHSPTHGVLGMIAEEAAKGQICLERFLERKELVPTNFQSAPIPLYTRSTAISRKLGTGRVYLVGDAAGHVKVTTVGGILTGLRGALAVSEAIFNGGTSRELGTLHRELDVHWLIRRSLHAFHQRDYVRLLDMLNSATKRSLSALTRDDPIKLLFHLFIRQPRFLLLGLRGLLH